MGYTYGANKEQTESNFFKGVKGQSNWRKESHKGIIKGEVAFWRHRHNKGFVAINTVEPGAPAWDLGKYQVQISTPHSLFDKYFKKRSKAISYAKNWMKKHPRG